MLKREEAVTPEASVVPVKVPAAAGVCHVAAVPEVATGTIPTEGVPVTGTGTTAAIFTFTFAVVAAFVLLSEVGCVVAVMGQEVKSIPAVFSL